jgi:mannose-6-phosphate isomerase-like protein (cupin superfamily)
MSGGKATTGLVRCGGVENIEKLTLENSRYRRVVYTDSTCQIVLMSLKAGQKIGKEAHPNITQFFRIEHGKGTIRMDDVTWNISNNFAMVVPPKVYHEVTNTGKTDLKLYTIYSYAELKDAPHKPDSFQDSPEGPEIQYDYEIPNRPFTYKSNISSRFNVSFEK